MISHSGDGLSVVRIEFQDDEDADKKYEEVVREVNALAPALPKEIFRSEVRRFSASDVAILQAALVSENASFQQLENQAENLEKRLEKVAGIKEAIVYGLPEKQVEIALNLPKMASENIPLARLIQLLETENLNIPGGALHAGARKFNVRTSGDFDGIDEIRNLVLIQGPARTLFLKDIAQVEWAYAQPTHIARWNGHRAAFVTASMKDKQNIYTVGDAVKKEVASFKSALPPNIDFQIVFDQNKSVPNRLSRFAKDFGIAIALVALTLLPLGLRAAGIVMISIPLSLAIGLALLQMFGYSLNQLSIVGLIVALGILVDDSIVVVENIERWMREGHSRREAAILGTKQIGLAVLGCTATLIMAFLPLLFLPGSAGDFIRSLPMAVVCSVVASLFVSITIVPFLASRLLENHQTSEGNIFLRGLKWMIGGSYARLLHQALIWPKTAMLIAAFIFGGFLLLAKNVGFGLFPASERPMFYIDMDAATGTNILETDRITAQVDSVLKQNLASKRGEKWQKGQPVRIEQFASNVGRGNPRVYYNVLPSNESAVSSQIFVLLQEKTPPEQKIAFIDEMRKKLRGIAGAEIKVQNFEQGPPVPAPIELRIFGDDLDTLRSLAADVKKMVSETDGTIYVSNPIEESATDLKVKINKEKAALLGIPSAEIDRAVRMAVAGLEIGTFTGPDGDETAINLTLPKDQFADFSIFNLLWVNSLGGSSVPLSQVAEVVFEPSTNSIYHQKKERLTTVTAFVKTGFEVQKLNASFSERLPKMLWPEGYSFEVAGEEEQKKESFGNMGTIILITVFGFLAILILEFKTFKSTAIVLSVIPLGVIGVIAVLLITGYPFSFTVVVGLIALVGIEVKNSILLVDFTNQLREQGKSLDDAIQEAGEIRFVPIVLTSLTAIGGLIPLAIEENPLYSPLAYVLIGGLISSTLLSRIVTPVLYKLLPPSIELKEQELNG